MPNSSFALWGGRSLIAVALLIGIVSIFGYARYARFHSRIEALKAAGELPSFEELSFEVETPENDALFYLNEIFDSAQAANRVFSEFEAEQNSSRTSDEAFSLFDSLSSEYPKLFDTISLAAAAPEMSYKIEFDDAPSDLLKLSNVLRLLDWKCEIQIARDEFDSAFDTAVELFRLGKLKSKRGTLLDSLQANFMQRRASRRLVEASAEKAFSVENLELVKSLLEDVEPLANLQRSLLFERALGTYGMINVNDVREFRGPYENPLSTEALTMQFQFGPAVVVGNDYLDSMETAIKNCELPLSEEVTFGPNNNSFILDAFGGDAAPVYERIRMSVGESVAQNRILQIVLALDREPSAAERNDWPREYLIEIGVAEEATIDPFDGKPMRIKRENGRWVVYSCGRDRLDDGGNRESDCGFFQMKNPKD